MTLTVHVVAESAEHFEVWLDTEVGECDGICIGTGRTLPAALNEALLELRGAGRKVQQAEMDGWQPSRLLDRGPVELLATHVPDIDPDGSKR